jgi:hypothetical protein
MPSGAKLFLFILFLPILAVIGLDGYLAYLDIEANNPEPIKLSALGWIWQTYSPESHDLLRDSIGQDSFFWAKIMDPLLKLKALFFFGGLFALSFLTILAFTKYELGSKLSGSGRRKQDDNPSFAFDADLSNKKKKMEYKRK